MEKRKDIDMLRFYGGDIHQKNKEGEYVITNNLVNPKNKEEMLWGDRDAYRTLNALLFEGIENEKERIYKEKRKLNPVFIELIENTLDIYRGIFAVMCRKKENQLSVSKVKRVDRKASLMAYLKGHTESFVSCTKGEYDDEFASKNNIILLEIESLENTPYVDYQQVITMQEYCNYDEKEVLFPPFLSLNVSEIELTTKDNHIRDMYEQPPVGKYLLKMEEFPDYRNSITSSREELLNKILDEKDKAVLCLEHMNDNMWKEDYHEYVEWKNNLHISIMFLDGMSLKEIKKNSEKYGITDDVVAILITRPDLATGKDILNSLEYYHFRTGHSINFYLPGYGAYWTEEEYPDGKVVTEIVGVKWSFSNQRFVEFIEDMEKYSKWRYSGESDLIFAEVKNGRLSYERAMEFHLDNMLRDKAIISVNQFFEKIVRIGQEGRSMNQIGNKLGIDKGKQVVFDALLEKMPMHMGDVIKQEKYFCVKNIQK